MNANVVCILVNSCRISTIARASSLAVDNNLSVETNGSCSLEIVQNIEAVSNRWSSSLCPAWAAIFWNVLILVPWKVILTVHVSPVNRGWNILKDVPSVWDIFQLSANEFSICNTAIVLLGSFKEAIRFFCGNNVGSSRRVINWLREWIDSLVVLWVCFLGLSGNMPHLFRPSINWSSPWAVRLNVQVVHTSAKSEETLLTPVRAPRVSYHPVWLAVLNTPANNWNKMISVQVTCSVTEDTTSIGFKSIRYWNTARDWSTLINFLHHILFTFY